jgi:molybdopterin-guanine dinucleotide biosynthesis protein A
VSARQSRPKTMPEKLAEPQIAAAILAGGKATRYGGTHKGLRRLPDGATIVERLLRAVRAAGIGDVVICANEVEAYGSLGLPVIPDETRDVGPLGGIEAALLHFKQRFDGILILPCDLPALTEREPSELLSSFSRDQRKVHFAVVEGGKEEPLVAVVPPTVLDHVREALACGDRRVGRLWGKLRAVRVPFPSAAPFLNVNCPEDLERAIKTGAIRAE